MAIILGIETSCDDTGVALYDSKSDQLLAHRIFSQLDLQSNYGGVVPELASRDHLKKITPLLKQLFTDSKIDQTEIDAVAYTAGPGLNGTLLVGASVANGFAYGLNKPVIPIHHLEGHLLSPFLSEDKPTLPFLALLISGGNTQLIAVHEIGKYEILGETLDDAAGEAFDKTARMLGLPYPGGREIEKLAKQGKDLYNLPRPMLNSPDFNLSFSGLKTATLTLINQLTQNQTVPLSLEMKCNIAKGIEEAITDTLVKKSQMALAHTQMKALVVSGGVGANLTLRQKFARLNGIKTYYPPLEFCTDNAAMIAYAGAFRYQYRKFDYNFNVYPRWLIKDL